jgi:release factor glutamine methyltransferase
VAAEEEAGELMDAAADDDTLAAWLARREVGEPLAWITGRTIFCGHVLKVDPGVYVPRPQSEELARRAAAVLPAQGGLVADLCTGTGAVAVHLMADPSAPGVVGIDNDPRAVACARANGVSAGLGDLDGPLRPWAFHVVTAVAPYVPTDELRFLPADVQRYECRAALDGGPDGLSMVRRVIAAAAVALRAGGWVLIELGGDQGEKLTSVLESRGFGPPSFWSDEDGDLRGLAAQRDGSTGSVAPW